MRRNGVFAEFNKLHWALQALLIFGGFGLAQSIVRRAKCPPGPLV